MNNMTPDEMMKMIDALKYELRHAKFDLEDEKKANDEDIRKYKDRVLENIELKKENEKLKKENEEMKARFDKIKQLL
jgi:cell shape-determining protein MreC